MRDLTKGKPLKVILLFAIPIFIGNIFQLCYSLVDTRIVGQYLGETPLAAVASTSTLSDLLITFVNGLTNGFSLVVAGKFGAKDRKGMQKAIGTSLLLGLSIPVVISVLCLIFIEPVLRFLNVEEALLPLSESYVCVIVAGLIVTALYNILASTLRAVGDSVTPLIFLIIAAVCNVGLDVLFVAKLKLGVAGAAGATVLAQAISVILCIIYVARRYPELFKNITALKPDGAIISQLLGNGMSMAFMNSFVCIGTVCLQTQINTFGQDIIVAHIAARRILGIFFTTGFVTASALATFCGQNMGAGCWGRIREGVRKVVIFNWVLNAIEMVVVYAWGENLIRALIATDNPVILENAVANLKFNIIFFPIMVIVVDFRNAMQGFGDTKTPIISSMLELLVKILVAMFLCPVMGYNGIIICEPIAWAIMVIPLIIGMKRAMKKAGARNNKTWKK